MNTNNNDNVSSINTLSTTTDNTDTDIGFEIIPLSYCPHCTDTISIDHSSNLSSSSSSSSSSSTSSSSATTNLTLNSSLSLSLLQNNVNELPACTMCHDTKENWICLICANIGCSRYVAGHGTDHYQQTNHSIALSYSDMSIWCYECENYLNIFHIPILYESFRILYYKKFRQYPTLPIITIDSNNAEQENTPAPLGDQL